MALLPFVKRELQFIAKWEKEQDDIRTADVHAKMIADRMSEARTCLAADLDILHSAKVVGGLLSRSVHVVGRLQHPGGL